MAVGGAATKVAAANFPDQVTTVLTVIGADAALASVMGKAAEFGALVQRADGVGAECTKAHRGNVEDRGRVRLAALRPADGHAE